MDQIATTQLLAERGKTHGDYSVHALVTQLIKSAYVAGNYHKVRPEVRESLDMIAHKIGRILAGDPMHKDHWDDIAGYAVLISRYIDKNEKALGIKKAPEGASSAKSRVGQRAGYYEFY